MDKMLYIYVKDLIKQEYYRQTVLYRAFKKPKKQNLEIFSYHST